MSDGIMKPDCYTCNRCKSVPLLYALAVYVCVIMAGVMIALAVAHDNLASRVETLEAKTNQ